MTIYEWSTRKCSECKRERTHFRTDTGWHCIGDLPGRRYVIG